MANSTTYSGTPAYGTGKFNSALTSGSLAASTATTTGWTIEGWVFLTTTGAQRAFFGWNSGGWIGVNAGGNLTGSFGSTGQSLSRNAWHHIAVVSDGSSVGDLFVDGVYVTEWNEGRGTLATTYIGGYSTTGNEWINGAVDEVRVSKIRRYTGYGNFTVPTTTFTTDANTVGLFHLDGDGTDASAASASPAYSVTTALTGTGTLTATSSAQSSSVGTATLSGTGALSINGGSTATASVPFAGAGTLGATAAFSFTLNPALTGAGTLAVNKVPAVAVSPAFVGSGALNYSATSSLTISSGSGYGQTPYGRTAYGGGSATVAPSYTTTTKSYTASTAIIPNQERGWFQYSEAHYRSDGTGYTPLSASAMQNARTGTSTINGLTFPNMSLVFRYFFLEKFVNADTIDAAYIALLDADLAAVRAAGCKIVLRFAYTDADSNDATPARVRSHIAQLAPTLNKYADVVHAVEAGFIGRWGEWYYTNNYGDQGTVSAQNTSDRNSIVSALLSNLNSSIFVLLRYAGSRQAYLGTNAPNPGGDAPRIGFHNDAFTSPYADYGTYTTFSNQSEAANRTYVDAIVGVPNGGESASYNSPTSDWANAQTELAAHKFSFLNPNYYQQVISSWGQTNVDTVSRRLGARLRLASATMPITASSGAIGSWQFTIVNDGWQAPLRNRPVQVVLDDGAGNVSTLTGTVDVRSFVPGSSVTFTVTGAVPSTSGTYSTYLVMPDAASAISARPEYMTQLANTSMFNAATGRNNLNNALVVSPPSSSDGGTTTGSGSPTLSGSGALTSTTRASGYFAGINFAGAGTITTAVKPSFVNRVSLAGNGTLTATSSITQSRAASANLSGAGTLVGLQSGVTQTLSAALTGGGALTVDAYRVENVIAYVPLAGKGNLSADISTSVNGGPVVVRPPGATPVVRLESSGRRNITGYSVQEDATPLDAASTEGGVGTISFALAENTDSLAMFDTNVELDDDFRGSTSGTITGVELTNGINSVTADSRLGVLVGKSQALPITGTFEAVARYYLSLGGISAGVYFDPRVTGIQVTAQGWVDDAWLKLKQLAIANRIEISVVANNIVFRPVRSVLADVRRKTDFKVNVAKTDIAQNIEVTYYGNNWVDGEVIYPRTTDEVSAAQVYTVEAGAVLEDDIQLTASVASVLQPICVDNVDLDYDGTQSVYSVRASDNSLVTAQNWTAMGGKIELSVNPDTVSLHIKITASSDQYYGPYRIAGRMKEVVNSNTVIVGPGQVKDTTTSSSSAGTTKTSTTKKTTTTDPVARDDYPWAKKTIHTLSPLRYNYRECVDFVAWRLNRDAGVRTAPWKYTWANLRKTNGNAIGWKHDWELHGWKTGIKPYPGCIAWFGTSAGSQGHVAYVQHVTDDYVTLEDYNWGGTHTYHKHVMKKTSVDSFLAPPSGKPATKTSTQTASSSTKEAATVAAEKVNPADSETDYASLRIVGTGALIDKTVLVLPTGAPADRTAGEAGVTIENIFVSDPEDAYRVGAYTATRYKGEEQTLSGTLTQINQRSGSGTLLYPNIADFNAEYQGMTIAQFNAQWANMSLGDFKAAQKAKVIDTEDNQVFGNVAGARFRYKDAFYRITSSTTTNSDIEFSATRDTMIADFNAAHAGKTLADFNTQYAGKTLKQFGRMPLQGG